MYNVVVSAAATTGNPEGPKTQQFSPQPPPMDAFLTARYEALQTGGVSRHRARDDAGPTYISVDTERRAAAAAAAYDDDYKPAVTMAQLMPLYASRHLHPSISVYQHQLQQQQQQQSSYIKTESTTCEQSHAHGKYYDCTMTFVFFS